VASWFETRGHAALLTKRIQTSSGSLNQNAANEIGRYSKLVMPGLVPGIHVLAASKKDVDGRDEARP
jgi:hypothetical protein